MAVTGETGELAAGEAPLTTVEAVVPGLDFANHSGRPTCRWELVEGAQVHAAASTTVPSTLLEALVTRRPRRGAHAARMRALTSPPPLRRRGPRCGWWRRLGADPRGRW